MKALACERQDGTRPGVGTELASGWLRLRQVAFKEVADRAWRKLRLAIRWLQLITPELACGPQG